MGYPIHGMAKTKIYKIWDGIMQRCGNPNSSSYYRYGGRGITVCERWKLFENFYADVGDPPQGDFSLDRVNNDGHYSPDNFRWATRSQQARNRRGNRIITLHGRTMNLIDWAQEVSICPDTIAKRIKKGWGMEAAIYQKPLRGKPENKNITAASPEQKP